ncbi:MAG TPA: SurA N-terminal domain-containing protein, partial [Abditibacteriaceae bacterium]
MTSNDQNDLNQPEEAPKAVSKPPRSVAARPVPRRKPEIDDEPYEGTTFSVAGIRSNLLHRSGTKVVLGLLIFIFAVASVLFSASMGGGGGSRGAQGGGGNGPDPIAAVAGQNIKRDRFNQNLSRQMQFAQMYGQKSGPVELMGLRQQTLQSLVEEAAQYETATQAGMTASDADIDKEIERLMEEQIKSEKGQDEAAYRRQIEAKYPGGEADYRAEMRKNYDREAVGRSLVLKKFEESVK